MRSSIRVQGSGFRVQNPKWAGSPGPGGRLPGSPGPCGRLPGSPGPCGRPASHRCRQSTRAKQSLIAAALLALCAAPAFTGCAAYHVGARSLYAAEIRTVYVPMIESNSYRRNLGEWLHEALCKRIEQVSHFKVVHTDDADSILKVKLITDTKRILMENPNDEPRQVQASWQISAEWIDNATGKELGQPVNVPLPPALNPIDQSSYLFPELGQSYISAELQIVQRLADQIVSMMEQPW